MPGRETKPWMSANPKENFINFTPNSQLLGITVKDREKYYFILQNNSLNLKEINTFCCIVFTSTKDVLRLVTIIMV